MLKEALLLGDTIKPYSCFSLVLLLGVYAISNHPIVQVLVVGYIVMVDKKEKLTKYGSITSLNIYDIIYQ